MENLGQNYLIHQGFPETPPLSLCVAKVDSSSTNGLFLHAALGMSQNKKPKHH